jgi:TM2 domain-containing membrane protein YozV
MLKEKVLNSIDPFVAKRLANAGEAAEQTFERRFLERKKSTLVAFLLSLFSLHRFYYGQVGLGILFIISMLLVVGWVWLIYDWCTMSKRVRQMNDDLAMDLLRQVAPQ